MLKKHLNFVTSHFFNISLLSKCSFYNCTCRNTYGSRSNKATRALAGNRLAFLPNAALFAMLFRFVCLFPLNPASFLLRNAEKDADEAFFKYPNKRIAFDLNNLKLANVVAVKRKRSCTRIFDFYLIFDWYWFWYWSFLANS